VLARQGVHARSGDSHGASSVDGASGQGLDRGARERLPGGRIETAELAPTHVTTPSPACRASSDARQGYFTPYQSALPTEKVAVDKNSGVICTPV
jgi:hypothetical protein